MRRQSQELFRKKCKFELTLRYELFYSLNVLLDPGSRIHSSWRRISRRTLGADFDKELEKVGGAWEIWPAFAALLPGALSAPTFNDIVEALRAMPVSAFKEKILRGLIHADGAVQLLLAGKATLKSALSKVPKGKREWIGHIGLFPYEASSPQIRALELLLAAPDLFRESATKILTLYWEKCFRATWERVLPQFRHSLESRERLFHSCAFSEFAKQALLRIEVDEARGRIGAIRGGYRVGFGQVEACYFVPSAFNDRRFWSAFQDGGKGTTIYFPYFDPSLTVDLQSTTGGEDLSAPAPDPALVFRALGDTTRFAIASILARTPTTAVQLAKMLSVSKPTISHHVHLLREAGLIQETAAGGSVELRLKRSVLEDLSALTVAKLFESEAPIHLAYISKHNNYVFLF